jgi:hypothetical protein
MPGISPQFEDIKGRDRGRGGFGARLRGCKTPAFPAQGGFNRADHVVLAMWLTVGVVESVWLAPRYKDLLGHAIGTEVVEGGITIAPRPMQDPVGRGNELSNTCSFALTGANGSHGVPPQLKV